MPGGVGMQSHGLWDVVRDDLWGRQERRRSWLWPKVGGDRETGPCPGELELLND